MVALGIGIDGTKHPLSLAEGSTENKTLVTGLITDLRDRGLDVTRPVLAVIDGSKALAAAIKSGPRQAGHPKMPGTQDQKCDRQAARPAQPGDRSGGCARPTTPNRRCRPRACWPSSPRELDKTHPGAAASLREGMAETLTILAPGRAAHPGPHACARPTRIESMIGICRDHSSNVKNWRDGTMALRWCAAGMLEADHQFRRVNGHLHLPKLRAALDTHFTENVSAISHNHETVNAA